MSAAEPAGRIIAAGLVDRLQAIWPAPAWKPETCAEYVRVLEDVPDYIARLAIETLRVDVDRPRKGAQRPSIAELQDACRKAWQHYRAEVDPEPGVPAAPMRPEPLDEEGKRRARAQVAQLRNQLPERNQRAS